MTLNPFVKAGIGLSFALLWSCPTLAEMTAEKKLRPGRENHRPVGRRP